MSKTNKKLIHLFCILLVSLSAQSQVSKRKVLSLETKAPLQGVNIRVIGTNIGTTTDNQGDFLLSEISKVKSTDTLRLSYVGHETKLILAEHILNGTSPIYLRQHTENLEEVVISSDKVSQHNKVPFDEMSLLPRPLCCFGAIVNESGKKIVLTGGDESYYEDNSKKRLIEDPALSNLGASLADLADRPTANLEWQHFNGSIYSYDFNLDTWEELEPTLGERAYHNAILFEDRIFVVGGKRLSGNRRSEFLADDIEILDLEADKLLVDHTNPHQAVNFGSLIYLDNTIFFGGSTKTLRNGQKLYSDKVHLYNFESGLWYELKGMSKAKETNGALIDDKVYMVGGFDGRPLKEIEVYDLNTEASKIEGELFEGMERPGITSSEGVIYIMENGKLLTYDTELGILNEYLIASMVSSPLLLINKGFLFAIGGSITNRYSRKPSAKMIRINIQDIQRTSVNRSAKFK
ncbi:carboxypeptidase-like regulatory domain-containing protein [Maribacter sp. R86514]|uniref:carboxypeptidase-like regulatory domain-containing protein n=1 Tax=Maribacter sp. R86514 TaxID=3093854 RepID=UPI0037C81596